MNYWVFQKTTLNFAHWHLIMKAQMTGMKKVDLKKKKKTVFNNNCSKVRNFNEFQITRLSKTKETVQEILLYVAIQSSTGIKTPEFTRNNKLTHKIIQLLTNNCSIGQHRELKQRQSKVWNANARDILQLHDEYNYTDWSSKV